MTKTILDDLPLDEQTKSRLRALARSGNRSDADLLASAAQEFLEDAEYVAQKIAERDAEVEAGGLFASNEDMKAWFATWGEKERKDPPIPTLRA